jgi:hypothetical protein
MTLKEYNVSRSETKCDRVKPQALTLLRELIHDTFSLMWPRKDFFWSSGRSLKYRVIENSRVSGFP